MEVSIIMAHREKKDFKYFRKVFNFGGKAKKNINYQNLWDYRSIFIYLYKNNNI